MNKEDRTYFEAIEHGIGTWVKRTASKVLPKAPLKTRVLLVMLGVFLLLISIFAIDVFLDSKDFYDSFPGGREFLIYEVIKYGSLTFGSIAMLFGKRIGWFVVASFLIIRALPRLDKVLGLAFLDGKEPDLLVYLYGPNTDVISISITIIVIAVLLGFMYSNPVRSLYQIERRTKFIPPVATLLLGCLLMILNNFL
ncbi:MAG: hypothetical protein ACJAVN_000448 [Roseivirga sp.]|jgi:hypothetical protein